MSRLFWPRNIEGENGRAGWLVGELQQARANALRRAAELKEEEAVRRRRRRLRLPLRCMHALHARLATRFARTLCATPHHTLLCPAPSTAVAAVRVASQNPESLERTLLPWGRAGGALTGGGGWRGETFSTGAGGDNGTGKL
eukprot:COSAG01_NODE_6245_length_3772_cov_12.433433_3_plen_142_part_00